MVLVVAASLVVANIGELDSRAAGRLRPGRALDPGRCLERGVLKATIDTY